MTQSLLLHCVMRHSTILQVLFDKLGWQLTIGIAHLKWYVVHEFLLFYTYSTTLLAQGRLAMLNRKIL